MQLQDFQIIFPLVISSLISLGVAYYAWRRRDVQANSLVAWLLVSVAWWSFFYALEITALSLEFKIWWARAEYPAIVAVPALWLEFVLNRTGLRDLWLRPRRIVMVVISTVTVVLVWTSDFHTLHWASTALERTGPLLIFTAEYGIWFWVYITYAYILVLGGAVLLGIEAKRLFRTFRFQAILLLLALAAPLVGNILFITSVSPVDLTPFGFTITGVLLVWGLFGLRLLDLVPMARAGVFEEMPDGIIVVDRHRRVVDVNPAGRRLLENAGFQLMGREVPPRLSEMLNLLDTNNPQQEMIARAKAFVVGDEPRLFDVSVSSVELGRSHAGAVMVFRDVTRREEAENALRNANLNLAKANQQLRDEITQRQAAEKALERSEALRRAQVAADAKEEERKHLAEELHDQTLSELNGVIIEMGFVSKQVGATKDIEKMGEAKEGIDRLRQQVRNAEQGLRHIVQGIYPSVLTNLGLAPALRTHFEQLANGSTDSDSPIQIELESSGLDSERLPEALELAVYRIVQQSVANSLQHASPKVVTVRLERSDGRLKIEIADDGVGFDPKKPQESPETGHFGLVNLRDRILGLQGNFVLDSEPGRGTRITAEVPVPVARNGAEEKPAQRSIFQIRPRG
ncbi:MAG: PAS domain-containing protein [Chloroflexi bacterium]|nr:PAS domain-containing protein [Chloroflexota bacterium]